MAPFQSIGKAFPAEPAFTDLPKTYADLRAAAITINRSRGQFIRQVKERDLQIENLQTELLSYANDAKLDYQEKAQLLAIVSRYRDVFAAMENAGDELVEGLNDYNWGAGPFAGGRPLGRLINAVRAFVAAWQGLKDNSEAIRSLPGT